MKALEFNPSHGPNKDKEVILAFGAESPEELDLLVALFYQLKYREVYFDTVSAGPWGELYKDAHPIVSFRFTLPEHFVHPYNRPKSPEPPERKLGFWERLRNRFWN